MIIDLDSIGNVPKVIETVFEPAAFDLEGENVELTGPVKFSGEAQLQALRAHIRGTVTADVLFECTRCLEPVAKHLEIPFESVFVDSTYEPDTRELEVTDTALDESLVEGGEIDLTEVVREQILLAVPIQIFCREDCRGLCAKCGANLNLIDCKCSDDDIDPRWAALKSLK